MMQAGNWEIVCEFIGIRGLYGIDGLILLRRK